MATRRLATICLLGMRAMNANSLSITIITLTLLLNYMERGSSQRCDPVPKYLDKLYRRLTIQRQSSGMQHGASSITSAVPWRNSSLRIYFNMSSVHFQTEISRAKLVLYRGPPSPQERLIYQQSFGLIIKDINTSRVLYNRTHASTDRYCLVKNVKKMVKRWQMIPESNQGLLLTVNDTGRYSTTLKTFYPKNNIYVPALALFIKPRKNSLKQYKMIPSQVIQILNSKT